MIVHCLNNTPSIDTYGDWEELSKSDLEYVDADEIWYWYATGNWEGSGQLVARQGDLYFHHDMGHCSCYGPTENLYEGVAPEPLESLKARWDNNSSYWKQVEPLFNAIK